MSGADGWDVDPLTRGVLLHVESLGYVVSVHRLPSSLLGTWPPCVEMHAVRMDAVPPEVYVARVSDAEGDAAERRCARELASMIGVSLA